MSARSLRRQVLLSTAALAGALGGYTRGAYAQTCPYNGATSRFECQGGGNATPSVPADDATVVTLGPPNTFDVDTGAGNALTITGAGALSFTDAYAATILDSNDAPNSTALQITSTGNIGGGSDGSVTVETSGTLIGSDRGIYAYNNGGSGAISITTNGNVTGTSDYGISARNINGTSVEVTTGAGTTVTGGTAGILARNFGNEALKVEANGNVTGTSLVSSTGIYARGDGTSLDVSTAAGAAVTGHTYGIFARNYGNAALTVTTNGYVAGTTVAGIDARNDGTNLEVITAAGTTVSGGTNGIRARNDGNGALTVTTNGNVTGGERGILAQNYGNEALTVTANGKVTGTSDYGIYARNEGTSLEVTTGANTVLGGRYGIYAQNFGSEAVTVNANGNVTGTNNYGVFARNGRFNQSAGTDVTVTSAAGTTVMGRDGIGARNYGSGATVVTANGNVTGTNNDAIFAQNDTITSTSLTVTTGAGATILGGQRGIHAVNYGTGATTVIANGNVTGTSLFGIDARNDGSSLDVTTAAGSVVFGGYRGLSARNYGTRALTVTTSGNVTGTSDDGIYALNDGTSLEVTTAAGTTVMGGNRGIVAQNFGREAVVTANGNVTGTTHGIFARNGNFFTTAGTDLTVTTGAGSTVTGDVGIDARNYGSGAVTVIANGNVTGTNDDGIYAQHATGGPIAITIGTGGTVTSDGVGAGDFAIRTREGASSVTVAGILNGGGGGAVQFATGVFADRLELQPGFGITGNVFANDGIDTLAFGGSGSGTFDLSRIDTTPAAPTQQFQNFETFQVESGNWSFSGTTAAAFTVTGGTVGGNPTFGALNVLGGSVAPGDSFGTVTVNGAFSMTASSALEIEVDAAGNNDKVVVNGTVNLTGATLRVLAEGGAYKDSTDYTIIENDGTDAVTGVFGTVTTNFAFLIPTVFYAAGDGNDVVLNLERNATLFQDVAKTKNQNAVASALDKFLTDNPLFLAVLNQTAAGARAAFDALSGEIHATVAGTLAHDSRYVREAVLGRLKQASHSGEALSAGGPQVTSSQVASLDSQAMALGYDGKSLVDAPERAPLAFWTSAYGAWGDFDSDGNAASADRDLGGFISGMDAQVSGTWRAGLATGASFSNVDVDARYSSADVSTYHLGGYLGGMAGTFALRGGGMWAWSDIETSRAVVFPGFFERQKANYDAETGQLFGEVAYPTQMGGVALEPFGGIAYVSIDSDSFRETGGAEASLRGRSIDQDVGYTSVGLRAATTMMWGGTQVTPHISAAWLHAFDDVTPGASLAFATTGIGFAIDGVPLAEDSALLDAGLDFAVSDRVSAGVSYTGQYGDGVTDNGVKGRFTWLFN